MKIINVVMASLSLIALCSCSAGITRHGYELQNLDNVTASKEACHVAIKNQLAYEKTDIEVLGSIEAYDTSVSVTCDEAYVLDIFVKDGCALGADVINVTEEKHPSFWSTCYRAKADFLSFKDREQAKLLLSDPKYEPKLIVERSQETANRNRMVIEAGVMGGILGGLMVPH